VPTSFDSYGDWPRTLLDTIYRLPSSYGPSDLVSTSNAGINGGYYVRGFVIADLAQMAAAARDAGAPIGVASAYRSYSTQASTFNAWVSETGYDDALLFSARAGHSEHQLGTTLDFKSAGGPDPWDVNFGSTAAGSWLHANAWRYGFVMSYPYGSTPVTCYGYEPWHYRYFGRELATAIHESGATSREYLWDHGSAMTTPPTSPFVASPRPFRAPRAASDRPAKGVTQPAPPQVVEPEPSPEPSAETVYPDETPDLLWPAGLILQAAPTPAEPTETSNAQASSVDHDDVDVGAPASGERADRPVLLGQLGVVAGLVIVLAIDSRTRRRSAR
jgi:D-alanyl-D-alanine carboxypeptidase